MTLSLNLKWVKYGTLRWFGTHVMRRISMKEVEGQNARGRSPVMWRDRMNEHWRMRNEEWL